MATDVPAASRVGAYVLGRGGNAVDAAAASALALGVVNPSSSGIGGGGFALVYVAAHKRVYVLDFRETAPRAISPASFVRDGKIDPALSRRGGLAVAVPGEIAGLTHLVARFGWRSWRQAVAPARHLAARGFDVPDFLADVAIKQRLVLHPTSTLATWLYPAGRSRAAGSHARRPALARTLHRIARAGRAGFYRGPVARDLVRTVRGAGGVMTMSDLASYRVIERKPLWGRWRGYRVATMPLPSSGGLVILEALGILRATGHDVTRLGEADRRHLIAEILKHAFADRARFLGDASFSRRANKAILDPARLARLARRISLRKTAAHASYGDESLGKKPAPPARGGGTSHVCVVDGQGNAVALTTTVNGYFGSNLMTAGGVVLNNEMDDFSLREGVPNMFGLVQSDNNLVGPGKRPLSSMSPTLLFEGDRVVGCLGGSGGPHIISNVLQVMIEAFALGKSAKRAVETARLHHQWKPDKLIIEADVDRAVRKELRARGHRLEVQPRTLYPRAVQLVKVRRDGKREAASDSRKGGAPAAAPR